MRRFILILIALTWAIPGYATIDPDPDQIGVYFDVDAMEMCYDYTGTPVTAYVIITNPSLPDVAGVEYSVCTNWDWDYSIQLSSPNSCLFSIHPVENDECLDGLPASCNYTHSPAGTAAIVMTLRVRLFSEDRFEFFLGPYPGADGEELPTYWGEDSVRVPLNVVSGDISLPVATINGDCPVSITESTFSRVKCWYR